MSKFQVTSPIRSCSQLTPDIIRVSLLAPTIARAARPGQFVMVAAGSSRDPLLRRPFSIHNVTADGEVVLLYKIVGQGTRLLAQLRVGQSIDLVGPLGKGFSLSPDTPACLVGGGMGIAPLLFLAKALCSSPRPQEHAILLGARTRDELAPLVEDFRELGYPVHAATDDGSYGHHGFVTELFQEHSTPAHEVCVCGPTPLMAAIARQCLQAGNRCQASLETHMACGLGACLGCTIQAQGGGYKHVCKHGPVFDANEVLWTI
ncbi:dihydroorotate dehydrogenase electron transfer subunit [Desulfogranum mediterraneum]|uniref:dihydroorotate dehydrogenase electron transfer subunit n=1 Tax=Desulfogranum mediterraneum TaxID=160661 RepID=UPI000428BFDB|nr:dihydroorotate dehydrogenase electron transfer subunit [Desulfogranum mediterraneum]